MALWEGFRFHRLTQVPIPSRDGDPHSARRNAFGVLSAALGAAHAGLLATGDGAALATAWIRPPGQEGMQLLRGGRPDFPPAMNAAPGETDGARRVLFPPGAAAIDLPTAQVAEEFAALGHWVPCAVRADALWATASPREAVAVRRHTFDRYAVHLGVPFAFLVMARPLRPDEVAPELDTLVNEIMPLTRPEVGEAKRIDLERHQARFRELSRARVGGAWQTSVLVGGVDAASAAASAAVLCSAAELDGLPYVLEPAGPARSLQEAMDADGGGPDGRSGFTTGTELLTALTRPPDREVPGVRMVEPRTFDVTPELVAAGEVTCGEVLDEAGTAVGQLALSRDMLNRHTFVCGATGSGKSMTVRHLLTEASRVGLPWLVIEPAK
ncbi:MAG: helicase HerA-like domain-containing protein, partial [Haloechinothrix sp.]